MKIGWRVLPLLISGIGVTLGWGCSRTVGESPALAIEDAVLGGQLEAISVPFERYESLSADLPIGVFDSGIGGLTVLNEIVTIDHFNNLTHDPGPDGLPDF